MVEFCQRRYEMQGNLRMVESKTDMKARIRRSPDYMDNGGGGIVPAARVTGRPGERGAGEAGR
jgi:hypothetical protein